MTDAKQPAQFDWATELSDAEAHVSLSEQEAHEIGARLRSMGAKLKTYEDLGGAADDVQLLRMGYAAARLEIESLRASHGQAPASKIEGLTAAQEPLGVEFERVLHDNLFDLYEESPTQPAPQQEAQEPVARLEIGKTKGGVSLTHIAEPAAFQLPEGMYALYTEPQPSPAAQGDALSDDAVRVPLDSLHADAAYLIGRLRAGSMPYARVIEIIRERIDAAKAAIRARAAQGDALDAARYQWIRGPVEESTRYSRWRIEYWDGPNGWQPMQHERMDSAIDAARAAQEGK